MEIICKSCSKKIVIPKDKIPQGRSFLVSCPQCKAKITVSTETGKQPDSDSGGAANNQTSVSLPNNDVGRDLDFIEEGVKAALLCDQENYGVIGPILKEFGYEVKIANSPEDAINRIRFTVYDLIILNEKFGCNEITENSVLKFLQHMPMSTRRKIVLFLIGNNFQTFDNMGAFVNSVNLLINKKDIASLTMILKKFNQDHKRFYKIFNESLKKYGKG